jgi:hypothetical protein
MPRSFNPQHMRKSMSRKSPALAAKRTRSRLQAFLLLLFTGEQPMTTEDGMLLMVIFVEE